MLPPPSADFIAHHITGELVLVSMAVDPRIDWVRGAKHTITEGPFWLGFIELRSCRFSERSLCIANRSTRVSMFAIRACGLRFINRVPLPGQVICK